MSNEDPSPDGGDNTPDPNTTRELAKARADAKRYREEASTLRDEAARLHTEIQAEKKVADGLRGKVQQVQNEMAAKLAERDEAEAKAAEKHEAAMADLRKIEFEAKSSHEAALADASKQREDVILTYELRNAAIKAGVVNEHDLVKLLDRGVLKFGKDGEVVGVPELIERAKTEKPYLFTKPIVPDSTSSTTRPPKPDSTPKRATEMTDDEYNAALAGLLKA